MRASKPLGVALLVAASLAASCVIAQPIPASEPYSVAPRRGVVFYDVLAPYGEWFYMAPYGHVWRPHQNVVGYGFEPYYTGGYWIYSDDGWAFESDWSWGWAVYHYGRWMYVDGPGWIWIPGTEWAPAWVTWRYAPGYVGWYPLPPPGVTIVYSPGWIFVDAGRFTHRDFHRYVLPEPMRQHIFHKATPIGPSRGHPVGPAPSWVAEHGATIPRGRPTGPRNVASGATAVPPGAATGRPRWQTEGERAPQQGERLPAGRPGGEVRPEERHEAPPPGRSPSEAQPQERREAPPSGRPAGRDSSPEVKHPTEQPRGSKHPSPPPSGQPSHEKEKKHEEKK